MSEQPIMFERRYVWQPTVRWSHWVNVLCMFLLAVTGYYIGAPFVNVTGLPEPYITGTVRFIHYVSATIVALVLIIRFYWAFVGNRYARWGGVLPLSGERRRDLWRQVKYYAFLASRRPSYIGHNPAAGISYFALWVLTIAQGITGMALHAETHPGGFWWTLFGWAYRIFPNQKLRLIHHSMMWVFVIFFIVHLYMAILDDVEERDGLLSSIVNGVKWPHCEPCVEDEIAERQANGE